jgi:hypothetical protein
LLRATDIKENLVTHQHTRAAVVEAYLKRLQRHKARGPHDQLAAGCLVDLHMLRDPVLDHISLALADPCHVGRDRTADHRAELGGVTRQVRDPCAPNLILAGKAGDIATGAPDPLPLTTAVRRTDRTTPSSCRPRHCQGSRLRHVPVET